MLIVEVVSGLAKLCSILSSISMLRCIVGPSRSTLKMLSFLGGSRPAPFLRTRLTMFAIAVIVPVMICFGYNGAIYCKDVDVAAPYR